MTDLTAPASRDSAARPNVAEQDLRAAIKALPSGRFSMLADLDAALAEARADERRRVVEAVTDSLRQKGDEVADSSQFTADGQMYRIGVRETLTFVGDRLAALSGPADPTEPLLRRGDALPNGQIVGRDLYADEELWAQPDTYTDGSPIKESDQPGSDKT